MIFRRAALLLAAGLTVGSAARAADGTVLMRTPPPLRENLSAMPVIADPADEAQRRINKALARFDAKVLKAAAECKDNDGKPGYWERNVEVAMRGPGFLSFVITDNASCGGAHPNVGTMSIVYDLATGAPVDWALLLPPSLTGKLALIAQMDDTKIVTLASKRLYELYRKGYRLDDGPPDEQCTEAIKDAGADGPPAMMAWLDAKAGGLGVQFDLAHVVQACADEAVIPLATLRAEGAKPALLEALQAAHDHWQLPASP